MGELDYLYSDAINALVQINKQLVKVNGRLGLLTTNKKVGEIAMAAGLDNMMRIYKSEKEVQSISGVSQPQQSSESTEEPAFIDKGSSPKEDELEIESSIDAVLPDESEPDLIPLDDIEDHPAQPQDKSTSESSLDDDSEDQEKVETPDGISDFSSLQPEPFEMPQAPESKSSSTEPAAEEQAKDSDALKSQDELKKPGGQGKTSTRVTPGHWDEDSRENTGLILTDDSISGKAVEKKPEYNPDPSTALLGKKEPNKLATIFIGFLLLGLIGGGVYWFKNNTGLFTSEKESEVVEQPFVPDEQKEEVKVAPEPSVTKKPTPRTAAKPKPKKELTAKVPSKSEKIQTKKPEVKKPVERKKPIAKAPSKVVKKAPAKSKPQVTPKSVKSVKPVPKKVMTVNSIRVTSKPSGADVMVNYVKKGTTPVTIKLTNNNNVIIVKKKGYQKAQHKIAKFTNQKELNVMLEPDKAAEPEKIAMVKPKPEPKSEPKPKPKPIPKKVTPKKKPVPAAKMLKITSEPSGAEVLLNFTSKGVTPITVKLTNKSNTVILNKKGFKKYQNKILKTTSKTKLHVKLVAEPVLKPKVVKKEPPPEPEPPPVQKKPEPVVKKVVPSSRPVGTGPIGRVFVASRPPGAKILLDGKDMGYQTPHWIEVPSGSHTVKLTRGAQSVTKQIMVRPGKNKSEYLILK